MSEGPYRAPTPVEPDPYPAAWAWLRRRRYFLRVRAAILLCLLYAVAFAGNVSLLTTTVLLGFGAATLLFSLHPVLCPRCGASFYRTPASQLGNADRCARCRVKIGTTKAEAESQLSARELAPPSR